MAEHYIRLNSKKLVTHAFSDAFEQPKKGDICIQKDGDRHFNLDIYTEEGLLKWRWTGKKLVEDLGKNQVTPAQERAAAQKTPSPKYQQFRAEEYPTVEDQLDMLFHDPSGETWRKAIQAVKDKYPKPTDKEDR